MSEADSLLVKYRGKITGPHTRDELATMVKKGTLSPVHRVSADQSNWRPLHELQGWQHLWRTAAQTFEYESNAVTEPPPLPAKTPLEPSSDDRDEPLDVELL